jgi:outer membrane protein assembly factor BamB
LLLPARVLAVAALAVLGLGPAALGAKRAAAKRPPVSWLTYGFNVARTGYNPHEATIGPRDASRLHQLWSSDLGGVMIAQPVEAAGVLVRGTKMNVIYEGTEHGGFYAIRAGDGHVLWHKNLGVLKTPCNYFPNHLFGIGGAGTISFSSRGKGVVYVAGGDGAVHALNLATGREARGWPVRGVYNPKRLQVFGGLTLFQGRLYVTTASLCDAPPYYGGAIELSVRQHKVVSHFYPAGPPSGGISGGGIWGPGGVSIDAANGDVYAATGNALTDPQNYRYSEAVVRLEPSLRVVGSSKPPLVGDDVDFGATPLLFKPAGCPHRLLAAKNKSGVLVTYTTGNIRGGPLQRLQVGDIHHGSFNGIPAWDPETNTVYISNSSSSNSDVFKRGMVALKAGRDCKLSLAWQRVRGPTGSNVSVSPPTVANGVVYYGDGRGNTEFAFNAKTGRPLWSRKFRAGLYAAPTAVNGMLLVPAWDDHLYAFGVGHRGK